MITYQAKVSCNLNHFLSVLPGLNSYQFLTAVFVFCMSVFFLYYGDVIIIDTKRKENGVKMNNSSMKIRFNVHVETLHSGSAHLIRGIQTIGAATCVRLYVCGWGSHPLQDSCVCTHAHRKYSCTCVQ